MLIQPQCCIHSSCARLFQHARGVKVMHQGNEVDASCKLFAANTNFGCGYIDSIP